MSNRISSSKQKQKVSINNIKQKVKGLLSNKSKYLVSLGVIIIALAVAGFNVYAKNNPQNMNDSSILLGLMTNEDEMYETVTSNIDRRINADGKDRFSFVSVASANSNYQASLSASMIGSAKANKSESYALVGDNTLVKNSPAETEISGERHETIKYVVRESDTISAIANKFGIDAATILTESQKYADDIIKPGDELTILPVSGATERVDAGETLSGIAKKHDVEMERIMGYNGLVNATDIEVAQILIIPDGKRSIEMRPRPEIQEPETRTQLASNTNTTRSNTAATSTVSQPVVQKGPIVGNRFPYGYCTWYVAGRRGDVTWRGNAGQWLVNAQAQGRATGRIPAKGAILVTNESWWGHVAVVESVNGNSVTISEMNYKGFGIQSTRTISNSSPVIKGYIY